MGNTLLIVAAQNGHKSIAKALLRRGAQVPAALRDEGWGGDRQKKGEYRLPREREERDSERIQR